MQRGFSLIFIIISVLAVLVILSVPLPGYRSAEVCTESDPPTCLAKGWYLKMPLYQKLFFAEQTVQQYILPQTPIQTSPTPTSTSKISPVPTAKPTDSAVRKIQYAAIPGWSRYDNISGGYSVQYNPVEYSIQDNDEIKPAYSIIDSLTLACVKAPDLPTCQSWTNILIFSDYDGGSRRQWLETPNGEHASEKPLYYEDVIVAGIKALIGMSDNYTYSAIPLKNKMILIIMDTAYYNSNQQKPVGIEKVYQILSTFKFTN